MTDFSNRPAPPNAASMRQALDDAEALLDRPACELYRPRRRIFPPTMTTAQMEELERQALDATREGLDVIDTTDAPARPEWTEPSEGPSSDGGSEP